RQRILRRRRCEGMKQRRTQPRKPGSCLAQIESDAKQGSGRQRRHSQHPPPAPAEWPVERPARSWQKTPTEKGNMNVKVSYRNRLHCRI
ncbi:hypothetical protein PIB30_108871, partial [Stylosanthes scabra]|nr:hypothetical protein [Stylosanthes scabra]